MGSLVTLNTYSLQVLLESCHNCPKGNTAKVCLGNVLEKMGQESSHPFLFQCCDTVIITHSVTWHTQDMTVDTIINKTQTCAQSENVSITHHPDEKKEFIEFVDTSVINEDGFKSIGDESQSSCKTIMEKDPLLLEEFPALNRNSGSRESEQQNQTHHAKSVNKRKGKEDEEENKVIKILAKQDLLGSYLLLNEHKKLSDGTRRKKYPEMFTCEFCGKTFTGKDRAYEFYYHRNSEHTHAISFKCGKCSKEFWGDRELLAHRTQHLYEDHVCHICGCKFKHSKSLTVHLVTHSSKREHVCSYCDKGFKRRDHLRIHERIHTGHRPYKCQWCDSGYPQKVQLKLHMSKCPALPKTN